MKSAFKSFQIFLLVCGVFGADEDEVKSVSVMEGDSVTLNPDLTQIKKFNLMEWRFGNPVIAQTDGNDITYPSHTEIFRDRLQLDQTGSLTIKNMRTKHSGLYKLQTSHSAGTSYRKFNVTIYESVSDAGVAEMKSLSLMEGNPVNLQTGVTQLTGDVLIVWRFGDEGKLIAKADIEAKSSPLYYDERFRDRLKLDNQTGSLTITNTRTTDSGLYKAKISSNKQTSYKRFIVAVSAVPDSGVSPAAVAGVGVLLVAAAAVAAGVIYYCRKISELQKQTSRKSVSALEGDHVTLNPATKIQTGDEIRWLFGDEETLIAEIKGETREITTYDGPDGRFRDRLKLNIDTGLLRIRNTRIEHTGYYTLEIKRGGETLYRRFDVYIKDILIEVMDGDPVTLKPATEIQTGDEIQWLFGDEGQQTLIAEIKGETREMTSCDGPDGRFRDRLKLDKKTCSLTIRNFTDEHSGYYTLEIRRGRDKSYKTFLISVSDREITVMEEDPVTLKPATEIQTGDKIEWLFGDEGQQTAIAEIKGETREMTPCDGPDGIFRDRLKLGKTTGSLTIINVTAAHTGLYTLKIRRGRETLYKKFYVLVTKRLLTVLEGESVTLKPATEINKDNLIQWLFGDERQQTPLIEFNGETEEIFTYDYFAGGRFRDRLELDKMTGSLTIKNSRTAHSGLYRIHIRSSSGVSYQTFIVTVKDKVEEKLLYEGDSVTLNPDTEIQRDDQILWMFGDQDKLIAQIKGRTGEIYDGANKRFRDGLKLDRKTGSLTITNIDAEHTGLYKLLTISSSRGIMYKKFRVLIQLRYVNGRKGESVRLHTGLTEILTDDKIKWMFGDKNSLIAEIKGGTEETYDGPDGRFRDSLELNTQTGDLIIRNSTAKHAGHYKLKIRSSKGNTNWTFIVNIRDEVRKKSMMKEKNGYKGKRVTESVAEVRPLLYKDDVDVVNEEERTSSV